MRSAIGTVGGVVQEKWGRERCRSWTVLHAQCISALSSEFPISQNSGEAQVTWENKTIVPFSTFSVTLLPKIVVIGWSRPISRLASQRSDVFWDTVYFVLHFSNPSLYVSLHEQKYVSPCSLTTQFALQKAYISMHKVCALLLCILQTWT